MLLAKRIITACVSFILLFVIFYFAFCVIGGMISGAIAGVQNPENAVQAGEQAGALFVQKNIVFILLSSLILSLATSSWLSFFGVLPWCKKPED